MVQMLARERQQRIVELISQKGAVSISRLVVELGVSVSTVRRDIDVLAKAGQVVRVHGGATSASSFSYETRDRAMDEKYQINASQKDAIGRYAASLIEPGDFVYIDAGSTTEALVNHIETPDATYVTNSIVHARKLVRKGFRTLMVGGELKRSTEALVGPEVLDGLDRYHFTKGFWGTNGATRAQGYTTPDVNEAQVKHLSMKHTGVRYVLCDADKIGRVAPVTFAPFSSACLITTGLTNEVYKKLPNVVEISV